MDTMPKKLLKATYIFLETIVSHSPVNPNTAGKSCKWFSFLTWGDFSHETPGNLVKPPVLRWAFTAKEADGEAELDEGRLIAAWTSGFSRKTICRWRFLQWEWLRILEYRYCTIFLAIFSDHCWVNYKNYSEFTNLNCHGWGWFPLFTMIPRARSQWGRKN